MRCAAAKNKLVLVAVFSTLILLLIHQILNNSGFEVISYNQLVPAQIISALSASGKCLEMTPESKTASKNISNSKIALVLTVLKDSDYFDYSHALDTVHCYVNHFNYHLQLLNMTGDPKLDQICNQTDNFFKRHCLVVHFMDSNKDNFEYILFLDADIGVVNPCHTIQEYLEEETAVEITFYDRYYNDEIMAGSYLAKNTEFSRNLLKYWADYFYRLPDSFHGTDNGAIQQVFMELHFQTDLDKMQCYHLWNSSKNFEDLFDFEICTRHALGAGSDYIDGRARVIRKMTRSWARDGWLTNTKFSPQDFMFHGWKKAKLGDEWDWPFQSTTFNQSLCRSSDDSPFVDFIPDPIFQKSEPEIMSRLRQKTEDGRKNYFKVLEKLRLNKRK